MGVAGSALAASKIISSKPGGARLYLQRKNIQFSHKLGLLNDFEAAAAYDELRRHYNKLLRPKPIVLASSWSSKEEETKKRTVHYVGPFRPEMTQKEAKLILGLNDAYVILSLSCSSKANNASPLPITLFAMFRTPNTHLALINHLGIIYQT